MFVVSLCVNSTHTHNPFHEGEKTTREPEHGTDNQSGVVWSVAGENEWLIKLFTRVELVNLIDHQIKTRLFSKRPFRFPVHSIIGQGIHIAHFSLVSLKYYTISQN